MTEAKHTSEERNERRAIHSRGASQSTLSESPRQTREIERDIDDPSRLADEARENVEKAATELRASPVSIETEPPTAFHVS